MLLATFGIRKTIVSFDLAAVSGKVTGKLDNTNVKKRNPKKKTTLRARPSVDGEAKRQSILTMISQIPRGQVATYGQIARLAGWPKNSRQVGSLLRTLPAGSGLPWYRVVNSKGEISNRKMPDCELAQRDLLESEGVQFNSAGRIDLDEFQWHQ